MKVWPLNYARSTSERLPWRWLLAGLGVAVILGLLSGTSVRRVRLRVDPVTGSLSRQTIWPFGIISGDIITPSPLARRLLQIGVHRNPTWQFLSETKYNAWGRTIGIGCAAAPLIYQLRPVLQDYVAASTDEELRRFAQTMLSGTPAQQQAAITVAAEEGLAHLRSSP
jgi:hypothetical protein